MIIDSSRVLEPGQSQSCAFGRSSSVDSLMGEFSLTNQIT